jgi:hypothetical protein
MLTTVKAFAKQHYDHVVYLDFHEHRDYKAFFSGTLDVDTITLNITIGIPQTRFVPGKTCIMSDEMIHY